MNATEIFDTFLTFSDKMQARSEINRLLREVMTEKGGCGSCVYLMTQQCKREAAGRKVTCADMKCDDFLMDAISLGIIHKKEKQIDELKTKLRNI